MNAAREYRELPRPTRLRIVNNALHTLYRDPAKAAKDLADAARNEDWDIIAEAALAAKLAAMKNAGTLDAVDQAKLSDKSSESDAIELAVDIAENPGDYGLSRKVAKREILDIIKAHYPREFAAIPTSDRTLTEWWKKVDANAGPLRISEDAEIRNALKVID